MKELKFRVWHIKEKKMYYRGYQKLLHALLCDDDKGENDGRGMPVKRASYADCEFLESTCVLDRTGQEIFEGDILEVVYKDRRFQGVVDYIPDMFGSKKIHPLESVLVKNGIKGNPQNLTVAILGNIYQNPERLFVASQDVPF